MHETIGLLNQASDLIGYKSHHLNDPFKSKLKHDDDKQDEEIIPEWDLQLKNAESDKSGTDSGVDSHDGHAHFKKSTSTNLR